MAQSCAAQRSAAVYTADKMRVTFVADPTAALPHACNTLTRRLLHPVALSITRQPGQQTTGFN